MALPCLYFWLTSWVFRAQLWVGCMCAAGPGTHSCVTRSSSKRVAQPLSQISEGHWQSPGTELIWPQNTSLSSLQMSATTQEPRVESEMF